MQHIRASFDSLVDDHPAHRKTLEAGLLLALAGRIKLTDYTEKLDNYAGKWTVKGGTVENGHNHEYTVTLAGGHRWSCNCKAHEYQAGHVGDLLGYSGKVCKHVAGVAIVYLFSLPLVPPKNLFELVHRLVQAQWMPGPQTPDGKPGRLDLPGTPAWLRRQKFDGREGVCLQLKFTRSKPLIEWVTLPGQTNKGVWQLVPEAESRYREWVSKIQGV